MMKNQELPRDMIIPENNRDLSSKRNVRWLLRNLAVHNHTHPGFIEVMAQLKILSKGEI